MTSTQNQEFYNSWRSVPASDHLSSCLLDMFQQLHTILMLGIPGQHAELLMGPRSPARSTAIPLLMQSRMQLTSQLQVHTADSLPSFSHTRILTFFLAGLLSISSSPSLHIYWGLLWPKYSTFHEALLNLIRLMWAHSSSLSKLLWMASLTINYSMSDVRAAFSPFFT